MKKRKVRRLVRRMIEDAIDTEMLHIEMERWKAVELDRLTTLPETFRAPVTWPWVVQTGTTTRVVRRSEES